MERDEAPSSPNLELPKALPEYQIAGLPPAAYYIPDFITSDEEVHILEKIASAPKPRWKQLTHRRLQTWPSDLVNNKLIDFPLPAWLAEPVVSRLGSLRLSPDSDSRGVFSESPHKRPNHVLINEYPPEKLMLPQDGPAYHSIVCTVSLGASLCLNIYKPTDDGAIEPDPTWRILQEPRSLLIITSELYTNYLHGIADVTEDDDLSEHSISNWSLLGSANDFQNGRNVRQVRTSLTYRDVIKVSALGSKLSLFQKK